MRKKTMFVLGILFLGLIVDRGMVWAEDLNEAPMGTNDVLVHYDYQLLDVTTKKPIAENTKFKVGDQVIVQIVMTSNAPQNIETTGDLELNQGLSYVPESIYVGSTATNGPLHVSDALHIAHYPDFPNIIPFSYSGAFPQDFQIYEYFTVQVDDITGILDIPLFITQQIEEQKQEYFDFSLKNQNYEVRPDFEVHKAADKQEAKIDDVITYTLNVRNVSGLVKYNTFFGRLDPKTAYVPNSTIINQVPISDSEIWNYQDPLEYVITLPPLKLNDTVEMTYQARVVGATAENTLQTLEMPIARTDSDSLISHNSRIIVAPYLGNGPVLFGSDTVMIKLLTDSPPPPGESTESSEESNENSDAESSSEVESNKVEKNDETKNSVNKEKKVQGLPNTGERMQHSLLFFMIAMFCIMGVAYILKLKNNAK